MDGIHTWVSEHRLLMLLIVVTVVDVVTGISAAAIQKRLSSKISWAGANRKFLTFAAVFTALTIEYLGRDIIGDLPVAMPVTVFYVLTELISIVENLRDSGVPVPPVLSSVVERLGRADAESKSRRSPVV